MKRISIEWRKQYKEKCEEIISNLRIKNEGKPIKPYKPKESKPSFKTYFIKVIKSGFAVANIVPPEQRDEILAMWPHERYIEVKALHQDDVPHILKRVFQKSDNPFAKAHNFLTFPSLEGIIDFPVFHIHPSEKITELIYNPDTFSTEKIDITASINYYSDYNDNMNCIVRKRKDRDLLLKRAKQFKQLKEKKLRISTKYYDPNTEATKYITLRRHSVHQETKQIINTEKVVRIPEEILFQEDSPLALHASEFHRCSKKVWKRQKIKSSYNHHANTTISIRNLKRIEMGLLRAERHNLKILSIQLNKNNILHGNNRTIEESESNNSTS